jgi:hypothetical protein
LGHSKGDQTKQINSSTYAGISSFAGYSTYAVQPSNAKGEDVLRGENIQDGGSFMGRGSLANPRMASRRPGVMPATEMLDAVPPLSRSH